jgi:hypothetical protein
MTKREIILLADEFKWLYKDADDFNFSIQSVTDTLVRFCRKSNPTFKEQRFRDYIGDKCGPSGGNIERGNKRSEQYC